MRKKTKFTELFRAFISYYECPDLIEEVRTKATIKNYYVKYNNVTAYLQSQNLLKLKAEELTPVILNRMVTALKQKFGHDYAIRTAEICRAVLNFGYTRGLIKYNNLHAVKFKKKKPSAPIHLTPDEVHLLENYTGKHTRVCDLFLFQCYTGLDYGDLMAISKKNIISHPGDLREYIFNARKKTGIEYYIPLFENTRRIWQKYNYQFGKISNQKYNEYLKEIAFELGIKKTLTTHVGRKTFAMIKLNYESYSIEAVSKMMGHATVKTSEMYYAQVTLNLISRELDKREIEK